MIQYLYILQSDPHSKSTSLTTDLQFFFLAMKTFKIYSLSNFQIYNRVSLITVTMVYATFPWLIYFITESLYFLTTFTQFGPPATPTSGNRQSLLCIFEFVFCCCCWVIYVINAIYQKILSFQHVFNIKIITEVISILFCTKSLKYSVFYS